MTLVWVRPSTKLAAHLSVLLPSCGLIHASIRPERGLDKLAMGVVYEVFFECYKPVKRFGKGNKSRLCELVASKEEWVRAPYKAIKCRVKCEVCALHMGWYPNIHIVTSVRRF